jgi:hypothetical protein
MLSDDLYTLFRSDVVDVEAPYLWSDLEVWNYMNDAYRMFVRLTGGIPDSMSAVSQIAITAGAATSKVSPLVLRFNSAYLMSNGTELKIINGQQTPLVGVTDYGVTSTAMRDNTPGPVRYMQTNVARNKDNGFVRWIKVPEVNDTVRLDIYRLPVDTVTTGFEFDEIGEEHHEFLMLWMKARAYGKQDAECFDRNKRDEFDKAFRSYCSDAKAEARRYKSHSMSVVYGGI